MQYKVWEHLVQKQTNWQIIRIYCQDKQNKQADLEIEPIDKTSHTEKKIRHSLWAIQQKAVAQTKPRLVQLTEEKLT